RKPRAHGLPARRLWQHLPEDRAGAERQRAAVPDQHRAAAARRVRPARREPAADHPQDPVPARCQGRRPTAGPGRGRPGARLHGYENQGGQGVSGRQPPFCGEGLALQSHRDRGSRRPRRGGGAWASPLTWCASGLWDSCNLAFQLIPSDKLGSRNIRRSISLGRRYAMRMLMPAFLAVFLFTGCAGSPQMSEEIPWQQVKTEIPADKALVYVVRPYGFMGSANQYTININGNYVASL